ncbi:CMP-sialic acid transporter 1-like isoform X1 [Raphanus sativus]|uniref:CMP-sialic acid transporter 1-like isoform X1 n=1 Tax=Raphanus sativus TaxID=3726 RepID=A0A9W3C8I9_RAPSA|nr:CMP-sialic acid transporter 1-like isoform X1 [Raphanus sativus]
MGKSLVLCGTTSQYSYQLPGNSNNSFSSDEGGYKYDYATVPFLAEVLKLIISSLFLWRETKTSSSSSSSATAKITKDWKSVRLFVIPSIIYLIHNNVQFATLTFVDTSTYQIMGNLKIVTTALLFRLFLKRKLSNLQWMAIGLLAVGTTTSQVLLLLFSLLMLLNIIQNDFNFVFFLFQIKGCGEASCDSLFTAPIQGYLLGILSAALSALAGVYTEFLMKRNNDSLYWQNLQLYTFGSLFNVARLIADDFRLGFEKGLWWQRIFDGYSITTWLVVLNLGSTGLLVSWLMKYADNIVKVYSTSMAMLLTMVASIYLFSFKPTVQLFLGIIICIMSLHMYFAPPQTLVDLPVTHEAHHKTLKQVIVEEKTDS